MMQYLSFRFVLWCKLNAMSLPLKGLFLSWRMKVELRTELSKIQQIIFRNFSTGKWRESIRESYQKKSKVVLFFSEQEENFRNFLFLAFISSTLSRWQNLFYSTSIENNTFSVSYIVTMNTIVMLLSFENLREFVWNLTHDLLIASRFDRFFTKDSREYFHQIQSAVLVFGVVGVAQNSAT